MAVSRSKGPSRLQKVGQEVEKFLFVEAPGAVLLSSFIPPVAQPFGEMVTSGFVIGYATAGELYRDFSERAQPLANWSLKELTSRVSALIPTAGVAYGAGRALEHFGPALAQSNPTAFNVLTNPVMYIAMNAAGTHLVYGISKFVIGKLQGVPAKTYEAYPPETNFAQDALKIIGAPMAHSAMLETLRTILATAGVGGDVLRSQYFIMLAPIAYAVREGVHYIFNTERPLANLVPRTQWVSQPQDEEDTRLLLDEEAEPQPHEQKSAPTKGAVVAVIGLTGLKFSIAMAAGGMIASEVFHHFTDVETTPDQKRARGLRIAAYTTAIAGTIGAEKVLGFAGVVAQRCGGSLVRYAGTLFNRTLAPRAGQMQDKVAILDGDKPEAAPSETPRPPSPGRV